MAVIQEAGSVKPKVPRATPPRLPIAQNKRALKNRSNYNARKLSFIENVAVSVTAPFTPEIGPIKTNETTILNELPGIVGFGLASIAKNLINPPHLQPGNPFGPPSWLPGLLGAASFNWGSGLLLAKAPRTAANTPASVMSHLPEHYSPEAQRLQSNRRSRFR